jgi:hypothetical protein
MKTRKLIDNREVEEFDKPVTLKVYTKCPEKYMLTDLETGEQYYGTRNNGLQDWKKIWPSPSTQL